MSKPTTTTRKGTVTRCWPDRQIGMYRVRVIFESHKSMVSGEGVSPRQLSVGSIVVLAGDAVD